MFYSKRCLVAVLYCFALLAGYVEVAVFSLWEAG